MSFDRYVVGDRKIDAPLKTEEVSSARHLATGLDNNDAPLLAIGAGSGLAPGGRSLLAVVEDGLGAIRDVAERLEAQAVVLLLVAPIDGALPAAADARAHVVVLERLAADAPKVLDALADLGGDGRAGVSVGRRVEVLGAGGGPVAGSGVDDGPVGVGGANGGVGRDGVGQAEGGLRARGEVRGGG